VRPLSRNWQVKVLTQFVLAHLPFGEAVNHQLQRVKANREGLATIDRRRIDEGLGGFEMIGKVRSLEGATVVEVGTGWDALPTLMLGAAGAAVIHTYDHVRHLRADLAAFAAQTLAAEASRIAAAVGRTPEEVRRYLGELPAASDSLSRFLHRAAIDYVAPGDASKTGLAAGSVDLFYSFAVLEHVPEAMVDGLVAEAKRILSRNGLFYALVGLHDHYNFDPTVSDVNFLQYPEWLWALLVKNRISYHNRMRERDFLDILARHGADIVTIRSTVKPDDVERVKTMRINSRFTSYSPIELATTRTEILARFPRQGDFN
jgi:SAM-dependent methyltransferase